MTRITLITVFLVALAASAWADYQAGFDAYERGNYAAAVKEWRAAAMRGDARAQFGLGVLYQDGAGVTQNYAEAATWYRRAAEQGFAGAQFNLGSFYENGKGVARDSVKAYRWYDLAAESSPAGEWRDKARDKRNSIASQLSEENYTRARHLEDVWRRRISGLETTGATDKPAQLSAPSQ